LIDTAAAGRALPMIAAASTAVTETHGALKGERVVRGREAEYIRLQH
jgi:hypothetical protein